MDFAQAEHRYTELESQRSAGELDEATFRLEVGKLLLRDDAGAFWMLDAESGQWFSNKGEGWLQGDPHGDLPPPPEFLERPPAGRHRLRRALPVVAVALMVLLATAVAFIFRDGSADLSDTLAPVSTEELKVEVTIASPADGSDVSLGQGVAIESTIDGSPSLQAVHRVELQVNGETVDSQVVQSRIQADQVSLPLSQLWRPTATGEYDVTVTVLSGAGESLGMSSLSLSVTEVAEDTLGEPECIPDATFVAHVTIPPDTIFPPGARMDKVWRVRNSGSCAWGVGYELVQATGEGLGAPDSVPVPPTAAGESVDLGITFWAPDQAGSYASVWQLQSSGAVPFGPTLPLTVQVEALAVENLPPTAPFGLVAAVTEDQKSVRLSWEDRSDNEDAFRVYREDVEASVGLAPANAEVFLDEQVACGRTYRYAVVAFNGSGSSPASETTEVVLPDCSLADEPPSLILTVSPTELASGEVFTVTFQASDDLGLTRVVVSGQETGDPIIDEGREFPCSGTECTGSWPLSWMEPVDGPLTLVAVAVDSSEQESAPTQVTVTVREPE
jgi:hypothetical protein